MNSSIVVLANLPEMAEPPARVAASLGAPLHLKLVLLPLNVYPVMLEPELVAASAEPTARNEAETVADLRDLATRLPGLTEVAESVGILGDAVEGAVAHYHPLLLVRGLSPEHDLADHSQPSTACAARARPRLWICTSTATFPPSPALSRP